MNWVLGSRGGGSVMPSRVLVYERRVFLNTKQETSLSCGRSAGVPFLILARDRARATPPSSCAGLMGESRRDRAIFRSPGFSHIPTPASLSNLLTLSSPQQRFQQISPLHRLPTLLLVPGSLRRIVSVTYPRAAPICSCCSRKMTRAIKCKRLQGQGGGMEIATSLHLDRVPLS